MGGMTCSRPNCAERVYNLTKQLCHRHYRKQLRADRSARMLDAQPCVDRLALYRARRWTYRQIGEACGLPPMVIRDVVNGISGSVRPNTYRSIMQLPVLTDQFVTPKGFRRRVEALAALGWAQDRLAVETGYTFRHINEAFRTGRFSVKLGNAMADAYVRLSSVEGPSVQAVRWARSKGYAPPAAWDDDTIDTAPDLKAGVHLNEKRKTHPSKWTHCPAKHELSGPNLIIRKNGQRRCRTCQNEGQKRWRERQKSSM